MRSREREMCQILVHKLNVWKPGTHTSSAKSRVSDADTRAIPAASQERLARTEGSEVGELEPISKWDSWVSGSGFTHYSALTHHLTVQQWKSVVEVEKVALLEFQLFAYRHSWEGTAPLARWLWVEALQISAEFFMQLNHTPLSKL